LGVAEPFLIFAALANTEAGGVLRMKCNSGLRKEISTGMINPALSVVRALYSLQNAAIFTPC
jgi:hypothetical protein